MPKIDRHTVLFSVNSFAASMLALYIALAVGLPRPYWAMTTAYIVSQPLSGAVRSKAIYRGMGTILGGAAAVVLVPNLVNSPFLLCLAMSLWVAGCLVISLFDRTPRSYLLMLAGYTAAMIGFPAVSQPGGVFDLAVNRVVEIGLGIICATVVHSLVFPQPVGRVIEGRLSAWLDDADRWLADLVSGADAAATERDRRHLAAAASEIHITAVHLPWDTSLLRHTTAAVRALHDRMLMLIPLLSGVADRLAGLRAEAALPPGVEQALSEVRAWLGAGAGYEAGQALAQRLRARAGQGGDWRGLLADSLLVRLAEIIVALSEARALLAHLRTPHAPVPPTIEQAMGAAVRRPLHADFGLALRSGATAVVAIMITCGLWIFTGWGDGATAAMMAAVFCCFFASMDDPAPAIGSFGAFTLLGLPISAVYAFGILPAIDGFPELVLALAPVLLVLGLYIAEPRRMGQAMPVLMSFCTGLTLQETFNPDVASFLNSNLAQFVGIFVAIFVTRTMRSMSAEASVRRLLGQTWRAIERLARARTAPDPAGFAATLIDRLALLTPKLAAGGGERRETVGEDALRDLRVAMNLVSVQSVRGELSPDARARVEPLFDDVARHYADLARTGRRARGGQLLGDLDQALSQLASAAGEPERTAALGLVGLRRNLFPSAPPARLEPAA